MLLSSSPIFSTPLSSLHLLARECSSHYMTHYYDPLWYSGLFLTIHISHALKFCNSQARSLISFSVDRSEKFLSDVGWSASENDWCNRQTAWWGRLLRPWISYRRCQGNACLTCPFTSSWPPSRCQWLRASSGRSQLGARAYSLMFLWLHC